MKSPATSSIATLARFAAALVMAALGVALARYAEADDAPGGVVIGILLVAGGVALFVRTGLRRR